MKKVSIIIPCYNKEKYVEEAIKSALNQTYQNTEIIIVNDGSTDNSDSKITSLINQNKNIIYYNETENHGVIWTRNYAIEKATGEYILPLDADDIIEPTFVEKAVEVLNNKPNIGVVYSKVKDFDDNPLFENTIIDNILCINCVVCTALFRKSDFIQAGKYKEYMEKLGCEDWDLWLSFLEIGKSFYQINEYLFKYRNNTENSRTSITKNNLSKTYKVLLEKHFNLYISNEDIIGKIFLNDAFKYFKIKKYKTRFRRFFLLSCFEFLIIVFLIFTIIHYFNL